MWNHKLYSKQRVSVQPGLQQNVANPTASYIHIPSGNGSDSDAVFAVG
jgi:hypothetical protein